MAYKRQSPMPIVEGGTNTTSLTTTDGVIYFDGTELNTSNVGTSTQVFTSRGAGASPQFQTISSVGGVSLIATSGQTILGTPGSTNWTIPYSQNESAPGDPTGPSQAQSQFPMPVAGTLSNMYIYFNNSVSFMSSNATITLNKNQVNTSLTITVIPSVFPAIFSNTVNTVSVAAGDLIQFECSSFTSTRGVLTGQIVLQLTT